MNTAAIKANLLASVEINADILTPLAQLPDAIAKRAKHALQIGNFVSAANVARSDGVAEIGRQRRDARNEWNQYLNECRRYGVKTDPAKEKIHKKKMDFLDQQQREIEARPVARCAVTPHALESFLKGLRNPGALKAADIPPLNAKKSLDAQLADARAELGAARKTLGEAESVPRDLSNVKEAWATQFAKLRERGAPDLSRLYRPGDLDSRGDFAIRRPHGRVRFAETHVRAQAGAEGVDFDMPDTLGLMFWLFGDAINEKVLAMIDERGAAGGASVEVKAQKVADAQEKFVAALRRENEILCELEKQQKFLRTREVPIAIALGIDAPAAKILRDI
jgi:hypothetical protein